MTTNTRISDDPTFSALKTQVTGLASSKADAGSTTTALASKADLVAGKVPSAQLPAYVDDVLEFANLAALPATGSSGIIYVTIDTNFEYRWSGSTYIQLVASPGTTDNVPEGTTNKYWTIARTRATQLATLTLTNAAIVVNDTYEVMFGKIQAQLNNAGNALTTALTGLNTAASSAAIVATDQILAAFGKVQGRFNILNVVWGSINAKSPVNDTIPVMEYAPVALTFGSLKAVKLTSGTLTLTFQINGVPITGLTNLAITSTPQNFTATALNTCAVGDLIEMVISAAAGPPSKLVGTLLATR